MSRASALFFRGIRSRVAELGGAAIFIGALLAAALMWPAAHASSTRSEPLPRGADTLHIRLSAIDTLATFEAPTSVRRDARGRLYVLESPRHRLHVLSANRAEQYTIGGAGANAGQLRRPAGFDPTNGQALLFADTGNGRIQRLDASGRALEVLPIPYREETLAPVYPPGGPNSAPTGSGRPRAVQSTAGSGLIVLESDAPAVWYLDRDRAVVRRLDAFDTHFRDWRPQTLVRSGLGALWVLEAQQPRVLITDALGSIIAHRSLQAHAEGGFVDGFASGAAVGLVQPHAIALVDAETQQLRRHWRWPTAAAPLQSATASRDSLYLLAGSHLLAMPR